jgi:hypothetical protein
MMMWKKKSVMEAKRDANVSSRGPSARFPLSAEAKMIRFNEMTECRGADDGCSTGAEMR